MVPSSVTAGYRSVTAMASADCAATCNPRRERPTAQQQGSRHVLQYAARRGSGFVFLSAGRRTGG
jgi:hypothetical protein